MQLRWCNTANDCDDTNADITTSGTGDTATCAAAPVLRFELNTPQVPMAYIGFTDGGSAYQACCV